MKAVSSLGSGPWGRQWMAIAGVVVLLMAVALLAGGCGDSTSKEGTTGSQLDETGTTGGTGSVADVGSAGGASTNGVNQEDVMVDYTWDECIADMTFRYADEDAANRVCNSIRTDYGDREEVELETILPEVETKENVTADQGGGTSGGSGQTSTGSGGNSGGGTGGNNGGGGWGEIQIEVPPAP